ncbi:NmrA family NAD(P)-binding protein [Streptomyces sp. MST-110588]|nr:NmrA family NAD(P)-binding protein [Streptomyces sp. MST-110588]
MPAGGWTVRALTRDPADAPSRAPAAVGAEVRTVDMAYLASLEDALKGAHGVFSIQPAFGSPGLPPDFDRCEETRYGRDAADARDESRLGGRPPVAERPPCLQGRHRRATRHPPRPDEFRHRAASARGTAAQATAELTSPPTELRDE